MKCRTCRFGTKGLSAIAAWFLLLLAPLLFSACGASRQLGSGNAQEELVIVYQPSHQNDTGVNFNEALVCNAIVEAAMAASTSVARVHKVWSYNVEGLHHAREGSNTKIDHSSATDSVGRISGYTYEIRESNNLKPKIFVAIHNNGATKRNACWGYVHEGDEQEGVNRDLARELVEEVCRASGLENGGVLGDSSPNRNDYRCKNTGKLSFYSLDETVNHCPVRVLLEIGDNKESYNLLMNPAVQKKIGEAIQGTIERRYGKPGSR
ncbi:MAG: N-acetylmuramoyl-L-alanine amidase [Ignavibacteriales bacterium]|nr:N-acetylmuramoyl-L-alanine amidase [Ignavibacteriales bacterium]